VADSALHWHDGPSVSVRRLFPLGSLCFTFSLCLTESVANILMILFFIQSKHVILTRLHKSLYDLSQSKVA